MTDPQQIAREAAAHHRPNRRKPRMLAALALASMLLAFGVGGYALASSQQTETDALAVARRVAGKAQALERQVRSLGGDPIVDVPAPDELPEQVRGPAGIQGLPGLPGEPGDRGARGPRGHPGVRGEAGRPGARGEPGASVTGPRGQPGADSTVPGPQGEPGPQGPGPACEPNCQGPAGPTGPQGQQGVGIADITCDSTAVINFAVTLTDGRTLTFSCGGP